MHVTTADAFAALAAQHCVATWAYTDTDSGHPSVVPCCPTGQLKNLTVGPYFRLLSEASSYLVSSAMLKCFVTVIQCSQTQLLLSCHQLLDCGSCTVVMHSADKLLSMF